MASVSLHIIGGVIVELSGLLDGTFNKLILAHLTLFLLSLNSLLLFNFLTDLEGCEPLEVRTLLPLPLLLLTLRLREVGDLLAELLLKVFVR